MMLPALALGYVLWLGCGIGPRAFSEGSVPLFIAAVVLVVVKPR